MLNGYAHATIKFKKKQLDVPRRPTTTSDTLQRGGVHKRVVGRDAQASWVAENGQFCFLEAKIFDPQ